MVEGIKSHLNRDEEYSKILEKKMEERSRELKEGIMELTRSKATILNILEDVNKTKEELIQAKEYMESMINSLVDPMVTTDVRGIITFSGEGAEESLGYKRDDMVGRHISLVYKDGKEEAKRIMKVLEKDGKLKNYETIFVSRDGRELPFLLSASFLRDAEGKITGTMGIAKDISKIKRLEEELREIKDFLERILESSTDTIVTTDVDGKITFANSGAEATFGYEKGKVIGTHISQYYASGLEEAKRVGKIIKKEGRLPFGEIDFLKKDRTIITLRMSYDLLRDSKGKMLGIVAVGKDITEKKKMERELIQAKDSLEILIEGIMDPMATTDKRGLVTYINKGLTEILGYEKEYAIGKHISLAYSGGMEEAKKLMGLLTERGIVHNYETQFIKKDGSLLPAIVSISLLMDKCGETIGTLGICKDITEKKRLERELERLAITDNLTGLYNQRHFYSELRREMERAKRINHPLSLLLFDVDEFKHYNDTYGHLEGDKVLNKVGRVVSENIRENVDSGYRYGGDEFVIILPEAGREQALSVADRIRASFNNLDFVDVTLSLGLTEYRTEYDLETFVSHADKAMYTAKQSGGNRISVYA